MEAPSLQSKRYFCALALILVLRRHGTHVASHSMTETNLRRPTMCPFCFEGLDPQPGSAGLSDAGTFRIDLPGLPFDKRWSCQLLNHFTNRMLARNSMCTALQIAAHQHCGCLQTPPAKVAVTTICPDETVPPNLHAVVLQTITKGPLHKTTTAATTCGDVLVRKNWVHERADDDVAFFLGAVAAPACGCEPHDIQATYGVRGTVENQNGNASTFCIRAKEPGLVVRRSSFFLAMEFTASNASLDVTCGDLAKIARFVSASPSTWLPSIRTIQVAFDAHCTCADDAEDSAHVDELPSLTGNPSGAHSCSLCSGTMLATRTPIFDVTWSSAAVHDNGAAALTTISTTCAGLSEWLENTNSGDAQVGERCAALQRAAEQHCGCRDFGEATEKSSLRKANDLFIDKTEVGGQDEGGNNVSSGLAVPSCIFCPGVESSDLLSELDVAIVVRDATSGETLNMTCLELSVLTQFVEDSDKCSKLQSIARTSCGCPKSNVGRSGSSARDRQEEQNDYNNALATIDMNDACSLCSDGSLPFDVDAHDTRRSQLIVARDRRRNLSLTCKELNRVAGASFRRDTNECRAMQANAVAFCGCPPQQPTKTSTETTVTPCDLCPNTTDRGAVPFPMRRLSPYYTCGQFATLVATEENPDTCRLHQITAGAVCGCRMDTKESAQEGSEEGTTMKSTSDPCRLCGQGRLLPHPARLVVDPHQQFEIPGGQGRKESCYAKELEANKPDTFQFCASYQEEYQEACCFDIAAPKYDDHSSTPTASTTSTTNIFGQEGVQVISASPSSRAPTTEPVIEVDQTQEPQVLLSSASTEVGRGAYLTFLLFASLGVVVVLAGKHFVLVWRRMRRRRRRLDRSSVLRPLTSSTDHLIVAPQEEGRGVPC